MNEIFQNEIIKQILEKYRKVWAIYHATSLLEWDLETYMPPDGVYERSIASAELKLLARDLILKDIAPLIEKVDIDRLNIYEKAVYRILKRSIDRLKKIPKEIQYELEKIKSEAPVVWKEAKMKDDFDMFKPYLEKIVDLNIKISEYLGYENHPYDALLDDHEEGLRDKYVDSIFDQLIPELKSILEKISGFGYFREHWLERVGYDPNNAREVNKEILNLLDFPWSSSRLDESAHPFTISMGIKDVRITTRYEGYDFKRTLFSVMHEFGHALYELQIDNRFRFTPLATGASLGIHESQSRFWENIIGKNKSFVYVISPILKKHLVFLKKVSEEELYIYFNVVRPGLIRVDADEVTYNFHIYIRYQLEKMLIGREIKVSDLPELWNNMMEELLGVRPNNYSEGVLQDIHWSLGEIGYFPTYTLGNILAAQIKYKMEEDLGITIDSLVINKDGINIIKNYLKEKIHKFGSLYPPLELIEMNFGGYNPKAFIEYLKNKYLRY